MSKLTKHRTIAKKHIHKRILGQLVIFAIMTVALLGIVTYDAVNDHINVLWILGSLLISVPIGVAAGRMFQIRWHEDTQKVMLGMDKLGFLLIAFYVIFRAISGTLFGQFFHGDELTVVSFSSLAGILIGRGLSMYRGIVKILRAQSIL